MATFQYAAECEDCIFGPVSPAAEYATADAIEHRRRTGHRVPVKKVDVDTLEEVVM